MKSADINIDYASMGQRIAKRRKAVKITQEKLAELTGYTNNHISAIENNNTIPSIETIIKIAYALETTPDYLLLGILKKERDNKLLAQRIELCSDLQYELVRDYIEMILQKDI